MQNRTEIWVTGLGVISAIGNTAEENISSLRSDTTGIKNIVHLRTACKNTFVAGEVNHTNEEIASIVRVDPTLPRTTLLALVAANEALNHADYSFHNPSRVGIILGTSVGGMDKTERLYKSNSKPSEYIPSHHCGFTTAYVARHFGFTNYVNTISTACSSGANAIMLGARLIKHGILDAVLAGGSDALSSFTLNGFRSLMILDQEPCRPFSNDRKGLNLGEGAGFVFIESKENALRRKVNGLCKVSGYGNTNDAFHQTASSPSGRGAFNAMDEAIRMSNIKPGEVDYINVHGTGTDNNDLTEGIAINRLFENKVPDFSSTKTFTGHCLGAAGAIEAVFSVSTIIANEVYANLRFSSSIEGTNMIPVQEFTPKKKVDHVLSNSFGFGGCDTSLMFSRIN